MSDQTIRLSVLEASRLFGVESKTVRRAIKAGELVYIVVRGRYKINFQSLVEWSQKNTLRKHKLERNGIGQYVGQWNIRGKLYSPGKPSK